jgi:hypothetical protein
MVGIWVETGHWHKLTLEGIYLFDSEETARAWQFDQLVAAGEIEEADGLLWWRGDEYSDRAEILRDICKEYAGERSFFQIMDVQRGSVLQAVSN